MPVTIEGSKGVNGGAAEFQSFTFGVVGDRRGVYARVTSPSNTVNVVGSAHLLMGNDGLLSRVKDFSLILDLSVQGVGGMLQGETPPSSGYLAVWHILNPSSGLSALVASDTTQSKSPYLLPDPKLPQGFTRSSLLAVLPTTSDRKLAACFVRDRRTSVPLSSPMHTLSSLNPSGFQIDLSGKVPKNSVSIDMLADMSYSITGQCYLAIRSGQSAHANAYAMEGYVGLATTRITSTGSLPMDESLSVIATVAAVPNTGSTAVNIYLTGYEI